MPPAGITLRPIRLSDWTRVHEWTSSLESCRYQTWGPNTPDETREFAEDAELAWSEVPLTRRVWVAKEQAVVVGLGELNITDLAAGHAFFGYGVHLDHWGRGIATQIARQMVKVAFAAPLTLTRLTATCDPRNVASGQVLRKIGMQHERRIVQDVQLRDGWRDTDLYALTNSESTGRLRQRELR